MSLLGVGVNALLLIVDCDSSGVLGLILLLDVCFVLDGLVVLDAYDLYVV